MDRGFFSNLKQSVQQGKIDADFNDIRRLQIMTDKFKRLIHLLDLNRHVCKRLRAFFDCVKPLSPQEIGGSFGQDKNMMENCIFRFETHTSQLKSLVSRAEGIGSMVDILLLMFRKVWLIPHPPRSSTY